jgi:general L-amino acid transport system substrate-binding protein
MASTSASAGLSPRRLGDQEKVEFVPTTGQTRFTALASGEIDLLARNTTWTFSRDVDLKFDLRRRQLLRRPGLHGPARARRDLGDGTRRRDRLHPDRHDDRAQPRGLLPREQHLLRAGPDRDQRRGAQQYLAGACDAYTTDASGLAATRATFENPGDHVILPEIISKEPLGPLVRHGDDDWGDINRWTLNALIAPRRRASPRRTSASWPLRDQQPRDQPLLGTEGELGAMLGLAQRLGA